MHRKQYGNKLKCILWSANNTVIFMEKPQKKQAFDRAFSVEIINRSSADVCNKF
jgi:sugar-specific transcriptional regulator TrmB